MLTLSSFIELFNLGVILVLLYTNILSSWTCVLCSVYIYAANDWVLKLMCPSVFYSLQKLSHKLLYSIIFFHENAVVWKFQGFKRIVFCVTGSKNASEQKMTLMSIFSCEYINFHLTLFYKTH